MAIETSPAHNGESATKPPAYKPSKLLFIVMVFVIVAGILTFILAGPLKGDASGGGNKTSAPSNQR